MPSPVTELLHDWQGGDEAARDRLVPLVYDDLRRLACRQLARERCGHTLQPTALVHEAYLRFAGHGRLRWQGRTHFFAIAAITMRRILVSHARGRRAAKRGGGGPAITLREEERFAPARSVDLLALDEALEALERIDARQCLVVELRYFGGLTVDETAAELGLSPATIKLDWSLARAWLFRRLAAGARGDGSWTT
jgi:RNA polymerase sigma factor (TIGR02999 family)